MTLYELNRGEITRADTNTEVDGCNSILVYAENELQAGWVGILFDADIVGMGNIISGTKLIPCAILPIFLDTQMIAVILGMKRRQVQHYCKTLGFKKMGRDYQLSVERVEQVHQVKLSMPIGRPRKVR